MPPRPQIAGGVGRSSVRVLQLLKILWAGPVTVAGLVAVGVLALLGASVRRESGVVWCWGWPAPALLGMRRAIALGHVVICRGEEELQAERVHELVHVRQFERWGVLLLVLLRLSDRWELAAGRVGRGSGRSVDPT